MRYFFLASNALKLPDIVLLSFVGGEKEIEGK